MERLGDIVARVLANVRVTMEEKTGEAAGEDAAPPLAQRLGSKDHARKDRTTSWGAPSGRITSRAARRPTVEIYEHALDHGSE
ncbi:hypothetical protein J2X48_000732 [Bosea sp. BE271]|nr:hypothetical protein [Bosea robiniae]MDR6893174.1 hypothetical protein [Bosea sp. BE109]MDR7137127.1 hypothetical protein [Bosea sp. BE168]MDR7173826.1 hypothetical protein [Bosea sp. BE271]